MLEFLEATQFLDYVRSLKCCVKPNPSDRVAHEECDVRVQPSKSLDHEYTVLRRSVDLDVDSDSESSECLEAPMACKRQAVDTDLNTAQSGRATSPPSPSLPGQIADEGPGPILGEEASPYFRYKARKEDAKYVPYWMPAKDSRVHTQGGWSAKTRIKQLLMMDEDEQARSKSSSGASNDKSFGGAMDITGDEPSSEITNHALLDSHLAALNLPFPQPDERRANFSDSALWF